MGTPSEEVGYSLAITITLCTPAPLCPLPPVTLPPSLFLLFRSSRPRLDSPFSLSFPLSLFSSLLCHVVSLSPRPPIILLHRPRLFRNCFQPSLLLLRLPLAGEFRVPFVTTYFTGVSLLLSLFPFSRLFPSLFIPFFPLLPGTPGWHQFLEPSHLPPDFCVSSHPLHFLSFSKWTSEFMRRN